MFKFILLISLACLLSLVKTGPVLAGQSSVLGWGSTDGVAGLSRAEVENVRVGKPICVCPRDLTPVCGEDGKTYDNKCLLKQANCSTKPRIRFAFRGSCKAFCLAVWM